MEVTITTPAPNGVVVHSFERGTRQANSESNPLVTHGGTIRLWRERGQQAKFLIQAITNYPEVKKVRFFSREKRMSADFRQPYDASFSTRNDFELDVQAYSKGDVVLGNPLSVSVDIVPRRPYSGLRLHTNLQQRFYLGLSHCFDYFR